MIRSNFFKLLLFSSVFILLSVVLLLTRNEGAPDWTGRSLLLSASPNGSLCSERSTARGPGQRVVSFSFHGGQNPQRQYFEGIEANAKDLPRFYPGWVMRVYHDVQKEDPLWTTLQQLSISYPHLDLCDVRNLTIGDISMTQPEAWGVVPLADRQVAAVASRNLDARISAREAAAVAQWLRGNVSFHVMRDTIYHAQCVSVGMWGARADLEPELVSQIGRRLVSALPKRLMEFGGLDQGLLRNYLWPFIKDRVMQHDSYFCTKEKFVGHGGMTPFPTRRPNATLNYVGNVYVFNDTESDPCPVLCRPKDHTDWETC